MIRAMVLIVAVVLAGCATPRVEVLSQTDFHPPVAGPVEVTLEWPRQPHKVFALLEDRWGGTPQEINQRLAAKGAELGADAVVITNVNDRTVTDWVLVDPCFARWHCGPHYQPIQYRYRSVRAKALKYLSR